MYVSEFADAYEDMAPVRDAALTTPVRELMLRAPLIVDADTPAVAVVDAMNDRHTGCALVQKEGALVGIFTERDVLRRLIFREGNRSWTIESVMTPRPETLPPDATIAFALNKMSVDGYRHIPIVDDDDKPLGVVSIKDIVDYVVDFFPDDILNLPPDPDLAHARSFDGG
jgi:CBS domain-containing protein